MWLLSSRSKFTPALEKLELFGLVPRLVRLLFRSPHMNEEGRKIANRQMIRHSNLKSWHCTWLIYQPSKSNISFSHPPKRDRLSSDFDFFVSQQRKDPKNMICYIFPPFSSCRYGEEQSKPPGLRIIISIVVLCVRRGCLKAYSLSHFTGTVYYLSRGRARGGYGIRVRKE